jgi:hypothetical protein
MFAPSPTTPAATSQPITVLSALMSMSHAHPAHASMTVPANSQRITVRKLFVI